MSVIVTSGTGQNSWVTEAEADTFMATRMGASLYWTDGEGDNVAAVVTAYKWLNSGVFSFPTTATQPMKDAQCEMALFLLQHQPDLDLRMGLQAQGVTSAGVVKEKYREDNAIELPIPPIVQTLLDAYATDKSVFLVNLERNEEEGVAYDAYTNRLADEDAE